jgi:hypothetical protein
VNAEILPMEKFCGDSMVAEILPAQKFCGNSVVAENLLKFCDCRKSAEILLNSVNSEIQSNSTYSKVITTNFSFNFFK